MSNNEVFHDSCFVVTLFFHNLFFYQTTIYAIIASNLFAYCMTDLYMLLYNLKQATNGFNLFRFTNNVLSTAQQVWLRKLGGAKPVVSENASGIISAGRAKRSGAQPERTGER